MDSPDQSSPPAAVGLARWPAMATPATIYLPVSTDAPLPSIGGRVAPGDRIGGRICPVDGLFSGVRPMVALGGDAVVAAVITDCSQQVSPGPPAGPSRAEPLPTLSPAETVSRLLSAGIVDDRRLSPSLGRQLAAAIRRPVSLVLVNALDSDPTLRHNGRVFRDHAEDVFAGARVLASLSSAGRALVVSDADAAGPDIARVKTLSAVSGVEIERLSNPYPQADPSLLLHTVCRIALRPGRLPTDQGVVLVDSTAAVRIARAMRSPGTPQRVPIAIRDHRSRKSHHLDVIPGTQVADALASLLISTEGAAAWSDDLLRGQRAPFDAILDGAELSMHLTAAPQPLNPSPCIRCGWCSDICPTRLNPAGVLDAAQRADPELADRSGVHACIECGLCAYVCPSRLPLLQAIRSFAPASAAGGSS